MPDKSQDQATDFFRTLGYGTIKSDDGKRAGKGDNEAIVPLESGRADMIVYYGRQSTFVEVKDSANGFPFAIWRENQRRWAHEIDRLYHMDYWLFIELGAGRRGAATDDRKRAWLMPQEAMWSAEALVRPIQKSIPLSFTIGKLSSYNQELRSLGYSMTLMFPKYELEWVKGKNGIPGHYSTSASHPFLTTHPAPMEDLRNKWILPPTQ